MRDYLKALRNEKSLSQQQIAEKLGISQNYYSWIENGERQKDMSFSMVQKLADAFKVATKTIISYEQEYRNQMKGGKQ